MLLSRWSRRVVLPLVVVLALLLLTLQACGDDDDSPNSVPTGEASTHIFGGGPVGGAFQDFADALVAVLADAGMQDLAVERTGGSAENLQLVDAGDARFGIVYAGDVFLGREGLLDEDDTRYEEVRPIASLYGGVIHLVVRADSGIETVADLAGKRIAPGNEGSGAALSAERYFRHLGLWDQITIEHLGYSEAADAMARGELDGFWVLAALPNEAVIEAAQGLEIRLIDTYSPAAQSGFFEEFPFYTPRTIPAGVYDDVNEEVPSFQDAALWVTGRDVPADDVYEALRAVYSDAGLQSLRDAHPAAAETTVADGLAGIAVPLHEGAQRFWEEQGFTLPAHLAPQD